MVLSFPFPFPCAWLRCPWLRVLSNGHVAAHLRLLSCCVWLLILDRLLLLLLLLLLCLGWLRVVIRLQLLLLQCSIRRYAWVMCPVQRLPPRVIVHTMLAPPSTTWPVETWVGPW